MCKSWQWTFRVFMVTAKLFLFCCSNDCVFLQRKHGSAHILLNTNVRNNDVVVAKTN